MQSRYAPRARDEAALIAGEDPSSRRCATTRLASDGERRFSKVTSLAAPRRPGAESNYAHYRFFVCDLKRIIVRFAESNERVAYSL
ncbi:hypothetical protein EVAR_103966_1 [Eumeta japonica]|uniref:Uncharacterized protein n=1 Tax=Eumeta variegata TaxID=151549 RepID=A0A4C1YFC2_EUMVA|nr:hypothetical protein EVAR_103966_1 [Eumeta japonica]